MMTLVEFENSLAEPGKCFHRIDGNLIEKYNEYFKENAKVGDGATVCYWSDREAYTIIKRTAQTLTLRRCKATLKPEFKPEFIPGGFAGTVVNQHEQDYDYEEDENGSVIVAHWSKKFGKFRWGSLSVIPGRSEHYDYNF